MAKEKLKIIRTVDVTLITFKPVGGGKLRCNQTGEIIKRQHVRNYRRMKENEEAVWRSLRPTQEVNLTAPPDPILTVKCPYTDYIISCPYCNQKNYPEKREKVDCVYCDKTFKVLYFVRIDIFGYAECPFCCYINNNVTPGKIKCASCRKSFKAEKT